MDNTRSKDSNSKGLRVEVWKENKPLASKSIAKRFLYRLKKTNSNQQLSQRKMNSWGISFSSHSWKVHNCWSHKTWHNRFLHLRGGTLVTVKTRSSDWRWFRLSSSGKSLCGRNLPQLAVRTNICTLIYWTAAGNNISTMDLPSYIVFCWEFRAPRRGGRQYLMPLRYTIFLSLYIFTYMYVNTYVYVHLSTHALFIKGLMATFLT